MTDLPTTQQTLLAADPPRAPEKVFANRRFLAAFILLLVVAAAFNFFVQIRGVNFRKAPVPMRMTFKEALRPDTVIGTDWVQVARKDVLEEDTHAALGTDNYLFCSYVKAGAISKKPEQVLDEIKGLPFEQQEKWLAENYRDHPEAVISLALTYYTGSVDTVAHIPERCYWGSGLEERKNTTNSWPAKSGITSEPVPVRNLTFAYPSGRMQHVTYFFQVNGRYTNDSLDVRETLANLFERRAYYAKIELLSMVQDGKPAEQSMSDFLTAALPKIEEALPDWSKAR